MKKILLTQGKFAFVDDANYEALLQFKWFAAKGHNTFYAERKSVRDANGKNATILMHRAILGDACNGLQVDHIDGNGLNNQRSNLRACTSAENQHNSSIRADNTSGFKGVYWNKRQGKWHARIKLNGKLHHLGYFSDQGEAAFARNAAAAQLHGDFSRAS